MFQDPVLLGGVFVGLVMGSFGYVLFRFVCRPVWRYRRLKTQIAAILDVSRKDGLDDDARDRLRQLADALHTLASSDLPQWYHLTLKRRSIDPQETVRHLQSLVNCREAAALDRRREAVYQSLGRI